MWNVNRRGQGLYWVWLQAWNRIASDWGGIISPSNPG